MINLSPLREMKNDIPLFVQHFISEMEHLNENKVNSVSQEAINILKNHPWPGNLRELKNVIQRAIIVCNGNQIRVEDLPPIIRNMFTSSDQTNDNIPLLKDIIEKTEKQIITKALNLTEKNKRSAAKKLGINRSALYNKIKKYGIK